MAKNKIALIITGAIFSILLAFFLLGSSGYKYSRDQREVLRELGKPDSFILSFSSDEDGSAIRSEIWYYHDCFFTIEFLNGEFSGTSETDDILANTVSTPYEPSQFQSFMTWNDVRDVIGYKPYLRGSYQIPEMFEDLGVELYYTQQVALGFDSDTKDIVYVDAMLLVPDDYETEEGP